MPKIIGFCGLARCGKTTAANRFREYFEAMGQNVVMLSFASALKDGLAVMGITKAEYPELYRQAAQVIGTDIVRAYDESWWVNLLRSKINELPEGTIVLIDDVRFPDEMEMLIGCNADCYFVDAGQRIDTTSPVYEHASERLAMDLNDMGEFLGWYGAEVGIPLTKISNNGSEIEYFRELDMLLEENYPVGVDSSV